MSCSNLQIVLQQVARGEQVDPAARQRALAHALTCTACSSYLVGAQALTELLRTVSAVDQTAQPPASVEASLQQAFRLESRQESQMGRRPRRAFWKIEVAAATAVVLAVAVVGWRALQKQRQAWRSKVPSAVAYSVNTPPVLARPTAKLLATRNRDAVDSKTPISQVLGARNQALRGFLPLPNTDDSDGGGTLAMVRIELQPGALEALGMPIVEGEASRVVTADVLIGDDGIARAIWFNQ
ncbi:MAG: hypothetical protein ACRD3T_08185 [Terriglobia bacterium]